MDDTVRTIAIIFVALLRYGVPIAAAVWLLRAVYGMSRTVEEISRRVTTIEEAVRHRT